MVKGQGLCLLVAQSNVPKQERQCIHEEDMKPKTIDVIYASLSEWYEDIRFYLTHGYAPPNLEFKKHRNLRLKETPYQFIDMVLFQKNYDGVFLRFLEKPEDDKILVDMHAGPVGGHF